MSEWAMMHHLNQVMRKISMQRLTLPAGFTEKKIELREDARVEELVGACGFRRHWLTPLVVMEFDWDIDYVGGIYNMGKRRGLEDWISTKTMTPEEARRRLMLS